MNVVEVATALISLARDAGATDADLSDMQIAVDQLEPVYAIIGAFDHIKVDDLPADLAAAYTAYRDTVATHHQVLMPPVPTVSYDEAYAFPPGLERRAALAKTHPRPEVSPDDFSAEERAEFQARADKLPEILDGMKPIKSLYED